MIVNILNNLTNSCRHKSADSLYKSKESEATYESLYEDEIYGPEVDSDQPDQNIIQQKLSAAKISFISTWLSQLSLM